MRDALPVLLAGLLAAAPAMAQTVPAPTAPVPPQPVPGQALPAQALPAQAGPAPAPAAPAAAVHRADPAIERRIAQLRSQLRVTPSEERPFRAMAEVMRENGQRMAALVAKHAANARSGNAVDQMQSYGQLVQAHAEDVQRLIPAFSDLYAALTPDQKQRADDSFRHYALFPQR